MRLGTLSHVEEDDVACWIELAHVKRLGVAITWAECDGVQKHYAISMQP